MPKKKADNRHDTIVEAAGKQRWKIKFDGFVNLEENNIKIIVDCYHWVWFHSCWDWDNCVIPTNKHSPTDNHANPTVLDRIITSLKADDTDCSDGNDGTLIIDNMEDVE